MSRIPVATELGRHDRFWPAVMASIAVHGAAILLAVKASSLPTIELDQKPIQARLVRLGEKKPEHLLPQKETPPAPEPAPATPAPPVAQPPPPATPPSPAAMPTPAPVPAPKTPARPSPARSPANGGGVAAALAKMEKQVQRDRWGDPNGDPEGDSEEGSEGERYFALLKRSVQDNFHAPSTLTDQERIHLVTKVTLWVESDGTLARWQVEKPSGNAAYDAAVERALRAARPPPPPDDQRNALHSRGITLDFRPND